jgi:peptidyl-prolyl cis-trans isomerase C
MSLKNQCSAAFLQAVAALALAGCTRPAEPETAAAVDQAKAAPASTAAAEPATPAGKVLVRVNGAAITEEDVRLSLRLRAPDEPIPPDKQAAVLETLIREELIAQRAAAAGLEQNQGYLQERAKFEAQLNAMRRRTLSDLYYKTQIEGKAVADEATVARYFEAHKQQLATELHVQQILVRRDTDAFAALEQLKAGKAFAEVARASFAQVPDEKAPPWDLGWMKWRQIPKPWREVVYDLKPGEHSGVIAGPRGRYWLVQVLDRRVSPPVSLADFREQIGEELRGQQVEALRTKLDREIRDGARIER